MEYSDITAVVKNIYSGTERKELMLLRIDSMCNWEQFLLPAPTSIAILGQLMAIATKKDFSLDKKIPEGGFKFVKYPGSFRACLVQISNSGCEAFLEAHKSMDKIRLYTIQFRENIRHAVNILINGSGEEKCKILPDLFEEMKKDADKCLHLAQSTEDKFYHVMLLIDETSEASAAVKGVYEDALQNALARKKLLKKQKEEIEIKKKEMDENKKHIIEEVAKAKTEFDKSVNHVPGMGRLLLMNTAEEGLKLAAGAIDMIGQLKLATISGGLSVLPQLLKGISKGTSKSSELPENKPVNNRQHHPQLIEAYQHATEIHLMFEKMYEMFTENTDSKATQEMKVNLDEHKKTLNCIKDKLMKYKDDFKKSVFSKDQAVLETKATCKTGIQLCEEMLKIKKKNNLNDLFDKVKKLKDEAKGLQLKARNFFQYSPISIPETEKTENNQKSQSKRTMEIASENARYEVEIRKKELADAKRDREKFQSEVRQMDERQNTVLEELSNTKINAINFTEIQETLKDGLLVLAQLKSQWSCLVLFFCNITNGIDVCLSQKTYQLDKCLRDGGYSVGHVTRDIVLEMAASINAVAYSVELIATAYTEISKKHLVQNTASLLELIAYDPDKEEIELEERRKQIDQDCKDAKAKIKALAEKSRRDMENKIKSMYDRLEEQLNNLPPLPPAKVQEIKENVENSDKRIDDYI